MRESHAKCVRLGSPALGFYIMVAKFYGVRLERKPEFLKWTPPPTHTHTLSRNTRNPNLYKLQPTTSVLIGLISLKINYLNLSASQAQLKIGWNLYYLFTIQNRAFQNLCPFIAWKYRLKHDSDKYVCKNFHTNFKEKKIKIKTFRKILFKNW